METQTFELTQHEVQIVLTALDGLSRSQGLSGAGIDYSIAIALLAKKINTPPALKPESNVVPSHGE